VNRRPPPCLTRLRLTEPAPIFRREDECQDHPRSSHVDVTVAVTVTGKCDLAVHRQRLHRDGCEVRASRVRMRRYLRSEKKEAQAARPIQCVETP
jgi:hypothetical protein